MHRGEQCVPRLFAGLNLLHHKFETIELAAELRLQLGRKRSPIAGRKFFQTFAPVAAAA